MGVPLGDGGEKKFNWASELSTIFQNKPIVSLAVGFLLGFAEFLIHPFGSNGVPLPEC